MSPSPLIPLLSRERGIWLVLSCSPSLWIPAYAGMTGLVVVEFCKWAILREGMFIVADMLF